jgi:hypothetical protein
MPTVRKILIALVAALGTTSITDLFPGHGPALNSAALLLSSLVHFLPRDTSEKDSGPVEQILPPR